MNNVAASILAIAPAKAARLQTPFQWLALIRDKLPASVIDTVTGETGISQAELLRCLGLVERTIGRRKQLNESLSQEETEKLVRFARIVERAAQVFQGVEAAMDWLRSENPSLEKFRPIDLLDADLGGELAIDALARIEQGIFL